jgi:glycosyltransferase involved in cell wall biosynthesis
MLRLSPEAALSPLICTTPYYAAVAERWKGPIIYYQTDLTYGYHGLKPQQVLDLDKRLCRVATVVCPNSQRIGHYMVAEADCDPAKIVVVPNATREENIMPESPLGPGCLPDDLKDLPRPVAGVLGNLAANLDWQLLLETIERTPEYSWAFIGPYSMEIRDAAQRNARQALLNRGGRVRFIGSKPYGLLQTYARALDVAVLPYLRKEPTFSGSSTRFYEHLAACRPIFSTRGFEELLHKEPLLRLVNDATDLTERLRELQQIDFLDGWEQARWEASRKATWPVRAATLIRAVQSRWPEPIETAGLLPAVADEMVEEGCLQGDFRSKFCLMK